MTERDSRQQLQEIEITGSKPVNTPIGTVLDAFQRASDANLPMDPKLVRLEGVLNEKKAEQRELERTKRLAEKGLEQISSFYFELRGARSNDTARRSEPFIQALTQQRTEAIDRARNGIIKPIDVFLLSFLEEQSRYGFNLIGPSQKGNEEGLEKLKDRLQRRITDPAQRLEDVMEYVRSHPGEPILINNGSSTSEQWAAGNIDSIEFALSSPSYDETRSIGDNVRLIFQSQKGRSFATFGRFDDYRDDERVHTGKPNLREVDQVSTHFSKEGLVGNETEVPIFYPFAIGEQAIQQIIEDRKKQRETVPFGIYAALRASDSLPSLVLGLERQNAEFADKYWRLVSKS